MVQEHGLPRSIKELMERMPTVFQPEKAAGANAIIQLNLTGTEPGSWVLKIAEGQCEISEGAADNPSVTITSPSDVWLKISRGELDGAVAFMSGQLSYKGNLGVLMQMPKWFGQG